MKRAVLDACVLYSAVVRDVLLSIAAEGTFTPYWSKPIHKEWQRNLLKDRSDLTQEILDKIASIMDNHFKDSCFDGFYHLIDKVNLPDKDDNHVLALAVAADADFIVTNNLKDFPDDELLKFGLKAISPDDFLCDLFGQLKVLVVEGLRRQRSRLKNPPKTRDEFVETVKNNGLTKFAKLLEKVKKGL